MIRGEILTRSPDARDIHGALEPDNMGIVRAHYRDGCLVARIEAERMGSIIATVNDYLVNLRIAEQVLEDSR